MGILTWIVLGLVAGVVASYLMGGGYGLVGDIILGILGALVGGYLASVFLGVTVTGFDLTSVLIAIIGSCLLIGISRALSPRHSRL